MTEVSIIGLDLAKALRGHLGEYGLIAPQGTAHLARLKVALEEAGSELPDAVVEIGTELLSHIEALEERIGGLSPRLRSEARRDETARRLMTIPARPGLRRRPCGPGPTDRELLEGSRLRRMDRSRAAAELHGRQGPAGADIEDGSARSEAFVDHQGHVRRTLAGPARCAGGVMAGADAGDQAEDGDRGRTGQ